MNYLRILDAAQWVVDNSDDEGVPTASASKMFKLTDEENDCLYEVISLLNTFPIRYR